MTTAEEYIELAVEKAREMVNQPNAGRNALYPMIVGILAAMLVRRDEAMQKLMRGEK